MEVRFAQLEVLVLSMATHVKSNASRLQGKQGVRKMANLLIQMILCGGYFYGINFSR
jgi:hypothetical protein